jgi:hypothetical protein
MGVLPIYAAANALLPTSAAPSRIVWFIFKVIHKVHAVCRGILRYRAAPVQPREPLKGRIEKVAVKTISTGVVYSVSTLRKFAVCVFVAGKVLRVVEALFNIGTAIQRVGESSRGDSPHQRNIPLVIHSSTGLLSPATTFRIKRAFRRCIDRISSVTASVWNLLNKIFHLSITIMDLIEISSLDTVDEIRACYSLVNESEETVDELIKGAQEFLAAIDRNAEGIQSFLNSIGISHDIQKLVKRIHDYMPTQETVETLKKTANLVKHFFKKAIWGFAYTLGMDSCIPDCLVPSDSLKRLKNFKKLDLFPRC